MNVSKSEHLLELAIKAGASHAEVYQSRSLSHPVFFEANRLKQLESLEVEGTALRLWRNDCPGLAVAYGDFEPHVLVERAIALSQLNTPEIIELSPAHQAISTNVGQPISVEQMIELGKGLISEIRDSYPEVICSAHLDCEQQTTNLINSLGLQCEYTETALSYYLGVEWIRGEDFLGIYEGDYTRDRPDPEKVLKSLLTRLQWAESNAESPTGRLPILFTANAATLLWDTVSSALNGKNLLDKSSPWSEKSQQLVLSPVLSLAQDPTKIPYDCPFDDEGTPTQKLSLIEQGRLMGFYSDRTTGRELGQGSTGNGFRPNLGSYPTPDLVNLIIQPGEHSLDYLISQLDRAILVDQLMGNDGDISGDFSVNVDLGYRITKGQITGRVKDTMVTGNVYNALKQVISLGNDSQWNGSCYAPSLVVDGLSVTSS